MRTIDEGWEWYNKHIAYKYDKTGCVLSELKDRRKIIFVPIGTSLIKVCDYFGIVIAVQYDDENYGFDYV